MVITKVTYYDINNSGVGSFLAKCSIVLEDVFMLEEVRIFEGKKGRYVVMPKKSKFDSIKDSDMNNNKEDVFHPVDKAYFEYMSKIILNGFCNYEDSGVTVFTP